MVLVQLQISGFGLGNSGRKNGANNPALLVTEQRPKRVDLVAEAFIEQSNHFRNVHAVEGLADGFQHGLVDRGVASLLNSTGNVVVSKMDHPEGKGFKLLGHLRGKTSLAKRHTHLASLTVV